MRCEGFDPYEKEPLLSEVTLNEMQMEMIESSTTDYSDLRALFINCTLKRSPERSHTQGLMDLSEEIMRRNGVEVENIRAIDHDIAAGVWPDMTEHGWDVDEWPEIFEKVIAADILVLGMPIWLGEKSSVCTKVIERLYGNSHLLNDAGQYAYYGRVGGCLVTGNEDGVKHCALETALRPAAPRLHDPAPGRRRLDRRGGARAVLSRRGLGRADERLHQPQHDVHDLEPAPRRADAQGLPAGSRLTATSARNGTRAADSTSRILEHR